ncbi:MULTISPECIES: GNAT family N-acetyltransferase [unclassified Shewanella]|uniref:GNAT family N-acetyltransferase n=1 Tax=unclassified Shewanella TaxID=196818 RepID=UPI000C84E45C|nr:MULTISPECIES: GNAT family N-acetyltransferase [unclassified Shewanella]MDO6677469.1 GNAT family N-acetyltransferase [Shewanella sp. 4_MG-2023]PMG43490.1 GNAT family N-acetyltransferase [Shewanella sp. 10N.286.52.B9]PMH87305.1 GNAT family N-acetyltransferase [Shewanella sp. 10N.286.48.B5]
MKIVIEPIISQQDQQVAAIIESVGKEFGAIGEGFGPSDAEVAHMSQYYHAKDRSIYLVACVDNQVVGGAGIAKFNGDNKICELRKLFLLPETRGLGLGKRLTEQCLTFAKANGFEQCYLDTLNSMTAAITLYEKMGFQHLDKPLVGTIHGGCDVWMLKSL